MLVAEATGGSDSNLVITALLHDAIEDCQVPRETIAEMFGEDVAALVVEVTDDKTLRKRLESLSKTILSRTNSLIDLSGIALLPRFFYRALGPLAAV